VPLEKERVRLLLGGLATHHAGLLPVYKALIEELFNDNLVKVKERKKASEKRKRECVSVCVCVVAEGVGGLGGRKRE
jgi:hypothetical protein